MIIVDVNGLKHPALWCWAPRTGNTLRMEIIDARPLFEIAQEFEKVDVIEKTSKTEGNFKYILNGRVLSITRPKPDEDNVQIILERGEKVEYNPNADS